MQSYKIHNGVLFFIVTINKVRRQAEKIYYAELSPLEIHHILQNENKIGKHIGFQKLSTDVKRIEQLFANFAQARQVQANFDKNHIKTNDKIIKECKNFKLYPTGDLMDSRNHIEWAGKEFFATVERSDGSFGVLDAKIILGHAYQKIKSKVSVNNVVYYEQATLEREESWERISIGEFFTITVMKGEAKATINFDMKKKQAIW